MARVVVAGAGAIGASIAYHLALRGADDVVLADVGEISGGATGKAMGGVRQQFTTEAEVRLAQASVRLFTELGAPLFEQVGYLFLATTERARRALLLEGAAAERIVVAPPGIDTARFASGRAAADGTHLVVSPGRLVWEKGHYDVIRALASLGGEHRLLLVGAGRERDRLLAYADDLGLGGRVEIRAVPYEEMPDVYASASAVVLASLALPIWEEQFGMVLAEAIAAGTPIVAAGSGAIPEVLAGSGAAIVEPGDWIGIARALAEGPLARPPAERVAYAPELVRRYSLEAAAERLDAAYARALG